MTLSEGGAANARSPDCLAWPRCTARAFTMLPPDPVRRGDADFDGRTWLAGIELVREAPARQRTIHNGLFLPLSDCRHPLPSLAASGLQLLPSGVEPFDG